MKKGKLGGALHSLPKRNRPSVNESRKLMEGERDISKDELGRRLGKKIGTRYPPKLGGRISSRVKEQPGSRKLGRNSLDVLTPGWRDSHKKSLEKAVKKKLAWGDTQERQDAKAGNRVKGAKKKKMKKKKHSRSSKERKLAVVALTQGEKRRIRVLVGKKKKKRRFGERCQSARLGCKPVRSEVYCSKHRGPRRNA